MNELQKAHARARIVMERLDGTMTMAIQDEIHIAWSDGYQKGNAAATEEAKTHKALLERIAHGHCEQEAINGKKCESRPVRDGGDCHVCCAQRVLRGCLVRVCADEYGPPGVDDVN